MKFYPEGASKKITLNGVDIPVPRGVKYVTINMNEVVQGWTCKPYLDLGFWSSDECSPIRIGEVDYEFGDDKPWDAIEVQ